MSRLLPAMQGSYNEWAILKTHSPAVKSIALVKEDKFTISKLKPSPKKYKLIESIELQRI